MYEPNLGVSKAWASNPPSLSRYMLSRQTPTTRQTLPGRHFTPFLHLSWSRSYQSFSNPQNAKPLYSYASLSDSPDKTETVEQSASATSIDTRSKDLKNLRCQDGKPLCAAFKSLKVDPFVQVCGRVRFPRQGRHVGPVFPLLQHRHRVRMAPPHRRFCGFGHFFGRYDQQRPS
jgi:hypothetical protein